MITTASKLYFGLGLLALAVVVRFTFVFEESEWPLGVLTDFNPFALFVTGALAIGALSLGALTTATRDADPSAQAGYIGADEPPETRPLVSRSAWPVVAGFGVGAILLGLAFGSAFTIVGLLVSAVVAIEWMVQAWADRSSADPELNRQNRNQILLPVEIPMAAVLGAAVVVFSISRLFLAVPTANAASWTALGLFLLGIVVFFGLWGVRTWGRNLVAALLLVSGAAILAVGITSAAIGSRDIEEHTAEHADAGEGSADHGADDPATGESGINQEVQAGEGSG